MIPPTVRTHPALWRAAALLAFALLLTACDVVIPRPTISVQVLNLCRGPNFTVGVFINESFRGNVTVSRTFSGIPGGSVTLRAVGTGTGGSTFRNSTFTYQDLLWTLCPPGGGTLSIESIESLETGLARSVDFGKGSP
jgi:hypothetical protein